MAAEFKQIAGAEAAERADRAAFDPSPAFERHRRHQASLGRELLQTVDTLPPAAESGRWSECRRRPGRPDWGVGQYAPAPAIQ